MALLDIIKGAALRCNLPVPSAAISSPDPNIQLLVACAQDAGDDMVERWGWQALKISTPATFTGDGVTTLFPIPAGMRTFEPDLVFISSLFATLIMPGPVNEDRLLQAKKLPVVVSPSMWRVVNNQIEFYPALALNEVVSFIYQGSAWITNSGGVPYNPPIWAADTDLSRLPERVVRLGAIYLWKMRKGFSYAEEMRDYELALDRNASQESTERMISMSNKMDIGEMAWPGTIVDNTTPNY